MRLTTQAFVLILGLLLLAADARAQQTGGSHGTIYSRFGLGERVDFYSSQAAMMGGAGAALPGMGALSLANPALWGQQDLVRLGIGAEVQGLRAEDALGQTAQLGAGHVSALQITLPLIPNRLGATAAFRPYTRTNYYVVEQGQLVEPQFPRDTVNYRVHHEGSGGIQEVQLGFGWQASRALSLGISGRALVGVVQDRRRTEFLAPNAFPETNVMRNTRFSGFGATLGAAYRTTGVFGRNDRLHVGAAASLPTDLRSRRVSVFGFSLDQDTLRAEARGTTSLPLNLATGVAYAPDARWLLAADVRFEPWGGFESDFAFTGYDPAGGANDLRDRLRIGGGFQLVPAGTQRDAQYFARTAYRLGAYYDTGYVAPRDQTVSTLALTGGVSLPALLPGTRFDIGFEAGTRGTTDQGLVRDLFLKGTATINFSERWFVRRQFG